MNIKYLFLFLVVFVSITSIAHSIPIIAIDDFEININYENNSQIVIVTTPKADILPSNVLSHKVNELNQDDKTAVFFATEAPVNFETNDIETRIISSNDIILTPSKDEQQSRINEESNSQEYKLTTPSSSKRSTPNSKILATLAPFVTSTSTVPTTTNNDSNSTEEVTTGRSTTFNWYQKNIRQGLKYRILCQCYLGTDKDDLHSDREIAQKELTYLFGVGYTRNLLCSNFCETRAYNMFTPQNLLTSALPGHFKTIGSEICEENYFLYSYVKLYAKVTSLIDTVKTKFSNFDETSECNFQSENRLRCMLYRHV